MASQLQVDELFPPPLPPLPIDSPESKTDAFLGVNARRIAISLSVFAAIRVLLFCAAFPLTNTIDERFHLLTIQMYAKGDLPEKDLPSLDPAVAERLLLYWSPEFSHSQAAMDRDGIVAPLYALPPQTRDVAMAQNFYSDKLKQWSHRRNYEAQSPPLYYVVAGAWYRVASLLGMRGWALDYWPRFLNPIVYALLVWASYLFTRRAYPARQFLQAGVPALMAVFPQDVFYGMNRDVFSAPLSAVALLLMLRAVAHSGRNSSLLPASFAVSLAFLSSISNFVLYGALAAALWIWSRRSPETRAHKRRLILANAFIAGVLPALWMLRNYFVMGDFLGGKAKAFDFGWTVKPIASVFHHPLFSLSGTGYFVLELTRRFWRGEYVWHNLPMQVNAVDRFYILSSALFGLLFAINLFRQRRAMSACQKLVELQAIFLIAVSVLFLAILSLAFDFHDCAYPSRQLPFFVSGRIISGAMLPAALIYTIGLELFLTRLRKWVPPAAALCGVVLFITISEVHVRSAVFASRYNFFALLRLHP
ncbi:MAG TPA: hypothetical protein VMG31_01710 [Verrucomicrobiae bacterium]|nr:hypothetical protein [Verrucomicrobiae bacterium]